VQIAMRTSIRLSLIVVLLVLTVQAAARPTPASGDGVFRLSRAEYEDRVRAAWFGQILAVMLGWPFEHKPASVTPVRTFSASVERQLADTGAAPVDDDWYYEMVALWGFEKYGIGMTADQLGDQWRAHNVGTWGSAFYTRQALERGVPGSEAGHPRHNRMWFTVGNQNRADFYGMLAPGRPDLSTMLARRLGRVNAYAEGIDGGVLIASLVSLAFVEQDVRAVVRRSVEYLSPGSPHRECVEEIIRRADAGQSPRDIIRHVEERWGIEYPGTNSAVWNAGFAVVALWFGEGDFWRSMDLVLQASDYADADCAAANVALVIGALRGMEALPRDLVARLNDRMTGTTLGFADLVPPVDESISRLAQRTVAIGTTLLEAHGGRADGAALIVPRPPAPAPPPWDGFHPNDFAAMWAPGWTLERAGYGAPGGGVRGVRGGTFLDEDVLATYPRDEVRGVKISRRLALGATPSLHVEVAADPGRTWKLEVYVDNERALTRLVDGGPPLAWEDVPPDGYPQPLHEYERSKARRRWQPIDVDLAPFAGREVVLRLYQSILVRNAFPGNAYWRNLQVR
jgi:hypothetical protein